MRGFVDLHSHWVAGIDDGARSPRDGAAMLSGLYQAGFSTVVATPHMRPGMFDNDREAIRAAFDAQRRELSELAVDAAKLPEVSLASEHFLDALVFDRLLRGEALPYAGGGAVLIELHPDGFPTHLPHRLFDLRRAGLRPVIAHPERYRPVWTSDACLDPLLDAGAALLLDVCALVGKYGRAPQRAAEKLLEEEAYEAACSDAHKPGDVDDVVSAIERLERFVGHDEARFLLADGPRALFELKPPIRSAGEDPPSVGAR
jgi:protein-tyrosine phosphatase